VEKTNKPVNESVRQFATFIAVGVVCALLDVGIMAALLHVGIHYTVAATAGFFLSFIVNYFLHTRLTFNARSTKTRFGRFIVVVAINYGLTLLIVVIFETMLSQPLLGKIISLPVIAVNGFFLSKKWVYR
jgi:putative flippase GtrA